MDKGGRGVPWPHTGQLLVKCTGNIKHVVTINSNGRSVSQSCTLMPREQYNTAYCGSVPEVT